MPIIESVTLIVYGWKSVEPGIMAWAFPSVAAAVHAARAMTNALDWAIVAGSPSPAPQSLDRLLAEGPVLLEGSRA
jgi:hypothetical protein